MDALASFDDLSPFVVTLLAAMGVCFSAGAIVFWQRACPPMLWSEGDIAGVVEARLGVTVGVPTSRPPVSERCSTGPASIPPAEVDFVSLPAPREGGAQSCSLALYYEEAAALPLAADQDRITRLASWLRGRPEVRVLVRAHADGSSSTQHDFELSERRAHWIFNRLVVLGVNAERISGDAAPVPAGHRRPTVSIGAGFSFEGATA